MQMTEFVALMTKLRACYQNAIADQDMWTASTVQYWEVMQHSDPDRIRDAFTSAWRKHPDWMPSLGQLMDLVESGGAGAKQRAHDAWPEVMKLAGRSSSEHSDPIARRVLRLMGGGKRLGNMNREELEKWGRKEFVELYEEQSSRPDADMLPGHDEPNLLHGGFELP